MGDVDTVYARIDKQPMSFSISQIDHLVLTVKDIKSSVDFYTRVLGMQAIRFGDGRTALHFGNQKINLHEAGKEFEPKAETPMPGSADLCLLTNATLTDVIRHLRTHDIDIIEDSVERTGATGKILSVYIRDPDQNLIEIANTI